MIIVQSHIAYGVPDKQDTSQLTARPSGLGRIKAAKKFFGFDPDKFFDVSPKVYEFYNQGIGKRGS